MESRLKRSGQKQLRSFGLTLFFSLFLSLFCLSIFPSESSAFPTRPWPSTGNSNRNGLSLTAHKLVGKWLFHKMIYKGQLTDPINPKLVMSMEFFDTGTTTLHYLRTDEQGFCERLALWMYNDAEEVLYQRVTWLHPQNRNDCGNDPDLQMDHESWSPVKVVNEEMHLSVPLADEHVILVWKRIP